MNQYKKELFGDEIFVLDKKKGNTSVVLIKARFSLIF